MSFKMKTYLLSASETFANETGELAVKKIIAKIPGSRVCGFGAEIYLLI